MAERPVAGRLANDCFFTDKQRLTHDQALAILKSTARTIADTQTVQLTDAGRRILAEPVIAPRNIPAHDNAAVDGYAFRHRDLAEHGPRLTVAGRIAAGHVPASELAPGNAVRIFTGAPMPKGADTVAMQEDCTLTAVDTSKHLVSVPTVLKQGANRRLAGEDVAAGQAIGEKGATLRAQDVAAIASTGIDRLSVFARLDVALASSGDEVIRPGNKHFPGANYDANHFMLRELIMAAGANPHDAGILPDRPVPVREKISELAKTHHAIIATGGASMGEEDHMLATLDALGKRHLWQLAVKPGRPMMFGQIGDTVFLGLPGNPVAAFVCFVLYARPLLMGLGGANWREPVRYYLPAHFEIAAKKADRREFLRGTLVRDEKGTLGIEKFARDGSGLISSLTTADGLIEIPENVTRINRGDAVAFIPFTEMGIAAAHG